MRTGCRWLGVAGLILLGLATATRADYVVLTPASSLSMKTVAASLDDLSPTVTYGPTQGVAASSAPVSSSGPYLTQVEIYKFDLSALSGQINSAIFAFNFTGSFYTGRSVPRMTIRATSSASSVVTQADFPVTGTLLDSTITAALGTTPPRVTYDLTSVLQSLVSSRTRAISIQFGATGGTQAFFNGPELDVTSNPAAAVPEPSSLLLCGLAGLAGAGGVVLRRVRGGSRSA